VSGSSGAPGVLGAEEARRPGAVRRLLHGCISDATAVVLRFLQTSSDQNNGGNF
jgi:hypothetical protein